MRVLLVTDWPAVDGGVETYLEQFAAGLRARGHEVAFLTSDQGRGMNVASFVARSPEATVVKAFTQIANPFAYRAARRAVTAFRPDVAVLVMFEMALSPAAVLGLGDVPYVHLVCYYKPICPIGLKMLPDGSVCDVLRGPPCRRLGCISRAEAIRTSARYHFVDRVVRNASARIATSAWLAEELQRNGVDALHMPWPVLPPGPGYERRRAASPVVVVAGRLNREKGLETLVDAVALLSRRGQRLPVRVLGEGPERSALEHRTREAGVADLVAFAGWRPAAEVDREMGTAWAVVAPSRWAEPLGLSTLEAIVRGVPVIGSSTGGHAETIEPGLTGLLSPNGDPAALADALAAITTGAVFPDGDLDTAAVERARRRHDLGRHLDAMESVLGTAAGA